MATLMDGLVAIALAMGAFNLGFRLGRIFERWDHR